MSLLGSLKRIVIAFLGITFVIVIHEFGHFFAARAFGVKVPVFSIGFGPEIFSIYLAKTKFQFSILLLGGYVSLDPSDLAAQSYFAKMVIILAGIVVNIIFSLIVFKALGVKINLGRKNKEQPKSDSQLEFGHDLSDIEVQSKENAAQKAHKLFSSYSRGFIGPVGILNLLGKSFDQGFDVFVYLLAIISLNVAFFNILPFEFFDGGQALNYTLHAIFSPVVAYIINRLITVLLFMMIIVFFMLSSARKNR